MGTIVISLLVPTLVFTPGAGAVAQSDKPVERLTGTSQQQWQYN